MFTDLVGSTALMSRVGEAAAEGLRREHFGVLRAAVAAHGGREVKNLGDGLMVVFSGTGDAVAAAVSMQQRFDHRNRTAEHPLVVRVGISVGDTDVEDGDHFGVPVVEAARLCAASESGGEILVTDIVRALTKRRGGFVFEPLGDLELKGLDEPVAAARVKWEPLADAADVAPIPLPARIAAAVNPSFVGRVGEHGILTDAWKRVATEGERRVMLLAGEPGIGKTTLSARFASAVHASGATVLYGRSDEDLGVPYQPWIEALSHLVAHAPQLLLDAHVADRGTHLARLVPALAPRTGVEVPAGGDADGERFVLFGCVADLLARASAEAPVLVVLDDLHWVDRASIQLLRHVATAEQAMRVGVLGTFRDSDIDNAHPVTELLAALHRAGCVDQVPLHGLSDLDVLALLEGVAGHGMDADGLALRDALLAETAGNPFFVAEILRHLAESGRIYQRDDGRWVGDADLRAVGLPVSVREVVGRRLAVLGPDTERLLSYAAVIGRDFDVELLAAVTDVDVDTVIDTCDAAVAASVLHTTDIPDRYSFAHALIAHTLYDALSPSRRVRVHRAIAEQIENLPDAETNRAGELAYHWGEAVAPTDLEKATRYAGSAGQRALDQLAPDGALRWFTRALELLDRAPGTDPRQRVELLVGLGAAQRQTGDGGFRETLLDASRLADQHDFADLLARAVLANNRGWNSSTGVVDTDRIEMIDRALARVGPEPTGERARLQALASVERLYSSPLAERVALADEAVTTARHAGDPAALVATLRLSSLGVAHPSTLVQRTSWADEGLAITEQIGEPFERYFALATAADVAFERADGDALDAHWAAAEDIAARVPDTSIQWNRRFKGAWIAGLRGDLRSYEQLAEAALTYGTEQGQPDAFGIYAVQLANLRWHQGRSHEMVPLLEQASVDQPGNAPATIAALAVAHAHTGGHDAARALITDAAVEGFLMPEDIAWSTGICCWTFAAWLTSCADVAPALRAMFLPYHDQITGYGSGFQLSVAHYLALLDQLLGDHDAAEARFIEALELHHRVRSPLLVANTHAAYARLLADRGRDDHDRARTMARAALDAAIAGGYGYVEADARDVLARLD
ncbi:MAG: AAA family ATPase [Actinobacteria bacterium]|nr:AAA family ATPase [Actinomycetota bacterium]